MTTTQLQTKATAAGVDWQKLLDLVRNMNWLEVISFIKQILDLWRGRPAGMKAAAPEPAEVGAVQDAVDKAVAAAEKPTAA